MPEENDADKRNDDTFFDQLLAQGGDGALDQITAIVGRHDANPFGQRTLNLLDFLFDTIDDVERVLAVTHHHDAADGFAAPVQLSNAAPDVATQMHRGHVFHVNRCTVLDLEDDVLNILNFFDVASAANVILRGRNLEDFAADIGVAHFDRVYDFAERDVVGNERIWIEIDLVLFYESADRRDF